MLSFFIADDQNNWDELLLHTNFAQNNHVCGSTRVAPNGIHIDRYPTWPRIIPEGNGAKVHQREKQDYLEFIGIVYDTGQYGPTTLCEREIDCLKRRMKRQRRYWCSREQKIKAVNKKLGVTIQ